MESWKQRINSQYHNKPYGRYKATNAPCRKHPKHIQSPGVCSICLNQKLSQLNNAAVSSRKKRATFASSFSSSLSSLSSSYASSYSSPVLNYTGRKSSKISGQEVLKKSRSMAFFLQRRKDEDVNSGKKINEVVKRGFWSKLLPRRIRALNLMQHSSSMREAVVH